MKTASELLACLVLAEASEIGKATADQFVELVPHFLTKHNMTPGELKAILVMFVVLYDRASVSFDDTFGG